MGISAKSWYQPLKGYKIMTTSITPANSTIEISCATFAKLRLKQVFLQISNETRLNGITIDVPADMNLLKEGSQSLLKVFELLADDFVRFDAKNATDDVLGDAECSHLEILENCQKILSQMSKTTWLDGVKIDAVGGDDEVFKTDTASITQFLENLSKLVGVEFAKKMQEPLFSSSMLAYA